MNKKKQIKLADKAIELIKEYKELQGIMAECEIYEIERNDDGSIITITDDYEDDVEYKLEKIAKYVRDDIRGYGPFSSPFYEGFEYAIDDYQLEDEFKTKSREEFINYVGELYYMRFRCEEIFKELEKIESEIELE